MKRLIVYVYTRMNTLSGVVLISWTTVCSLYSILYWFVPFASFWTGFILATLISVITAYPMGLIILSYASKLKSQSKAAEADNQVKNKLIYILGHDLKSPLNNIRQTLSMLDHGHIDQNEFNHLTKILAKDIGSTLNLTSNLIKWINIQQNDFKPEIKSVKISELIKECASLYMPIAREKNIDLLVNTGVDIEMDSDPEMIKIVLRNLLSNAIKFSHPHSKINIDQNISGSEVSLSVADYGVGMSKEEVDILFSLTEVKSQVGTNQEKGTGLGVNLCKTVIEKLGGKIWAEGKLGEGTTFTFTVPSPNIKVISKRRQFESITN